MGFGLQKHPITINRTWWSKLLIKKKQQNDPKGQISVVPCFTKTTPRPSPWFLHWSEHDPSTIMDVSFPESSTHNPKTKNTATATHKHKRKQNKTTQTPFLSWVQYRITDPETNPTQNLNFREKRRDLKANLSLI